MSSVPPEGSYLASHYQDKRRRFETQRVYYEDGRVEAFDGQQWWSVCRFSQAQVVQAKEAIKASGLLTASDLVVEGVHDAALLRYSWRLNEQSGSVTNWAYPARPHPVFERLEEQLDTLEAQAEAE